MKKLIFVVAMVGTLMFSSITLAITQEELEGAKTTLGKMQMKVAMMNSCIVTALRGKILKVDFTAEQIQSLKDNYTTLKGELQTLYQELP